jgi:hypothetical protein
LLAREEVKEARRSGGGARRRRIEWWQWLEVGGEQGGGLGLSWADLGHMGRRVEAAWLGRWVAS